MTRRRPKRRRPAPDADEIERLRRENERLRQKNAEQAKQIAEAQKQIADLERQLALRQQNSTTTSKPPSSDGLAGRQRERRRRVKSPRKPGGQPGHPGHSRPLVPPERVNATVNLVPDACRHCQRPLRARDDVGDPRLHQVTELPPIEAHITEYRCHRRRCSLCRKTTQASLPDEIAGQFGPQLTALIAYLTVVCRLPRLVVQRLLEGALQIPISLGSTQKAWEEASAAVAGPYEELQGALPHQRVLNGDETGHRTNGDKRWMWTLVARHSYCHGRNQAGINEVSISTLHSLALRLLRRAHLLENYPTRPLVLDDWELENIYDEEFGLAQGIASKPRREEIRRYYEALWSTGQANAATYIPPDPPITDDERQRFTLFHQPTSQVYSCVLPGEIVRKWGRCGCWGDGYP